MSDLMKVNTGSQQVGSDQGLQARACDPISSFRSMKPTHS